MKTRFFCSLALITALHAPFVYAEASATSDSFKADAGIKYESGKYGGLQDTALTTLNMSLTWDFTDATKLSVSVPYLFQRAPAGTVGGRGHGVHASSGTNSEVTASGIGDVVLAVDHSLIDQGDACPFNLGVRGAIKLGTASVSNGLGSGKTDYRLSAKVGRDWDQLSAEGEAGYAIIGSPGTITVNGTSQTLDYRNALFTSASLDYKFSDSLKIGTLAERQESIETGSAASMTLGVNANLQLMKSLKLNGELYTGLTSNSPDIGAGVSISKTF